MTGWTRIAILAAPVAAVWLPGVVRAADSRPARPNVLFIAIDDQNDWTGCLGGHPDAKTPNLDGLAGRGVLFTRAYCTAPHCLPSRSSLLSGLLPSTSGIYTLDDRFRRALPDAVTLPQHFKLNGYYVAGAGKIFHRHDPVSWHAYFGRPRDPWPPRAKRPLNGIPKTGYFDWGPIDVTDDDVSDGKIARWAVEQLGKQYDKPFFLGVGFFRPHLPWYAPRKYFDLYDAETVTLPEVNEHDLDDVPPMGKKFAIDGVGFKAVPGGDHMNVLKYGQWRQAVVGYLACCSFTDAQVGRVLNALADSPHADNTIVVLWSDHGWHLGEKMHWRKHALWEEANHCVITIAAPGVTRPDGRCVRTVSLLDLYPTLIELAGLPPREGLEGRSLVPLLRDPQAPWDRPVVTTYGYGNHAVRSERWRYIRYADGTEELYDHEHDDLEWTNLAGQPEYESVKQELARRLPRVNRPPLPRPEAKARVTGRAAQPTRPGPSAKPQ